MESLAERIAFIVKSKTNKLLDSMEGPEGIRQTIIEAKEEAAQTKAGAAKVKANLDKTKATLAEYESMVAQYNTAAENAVLVGDDASAVIALDHAAEYEALVTTWTGRVESAQKQYDALKDKYNKQVRDIKDMEAKAAEILADWENMDAAKRVAQTTGKNTANAKERFNRLAEKAASGRAEAEALMELDEEPSSAGEDVLKKYAKPTASTDARLAALKQKLGK